MIWRTLATVTVIAAAIAGGAAHAQAPAAKERVFSFHSDATSMSCPSLDWHVVVATNYTVTGMIGWQDMGAIARVTGSMDPKTKTYQLTANEVGGSRTATITGKIISPDHITANVMAPGVNCQNLQVWGWTPSQHGPGGAR